MKQHEQETSKNLREVFKFQYVSGITLKVMFKLSVIRFRTPTTGVCDTMCRSWHQTQIDKYEFDYVERKLDTTLKIANYIRLVENIRNYVEIEINILFMLQLYFMYIQ